MSWTQIQDAEKNNNELMDATASGLGQVGEPVEITAEQLASLARGKSKSRINKPKVDMVNHPPHYTSHPSGVECIQITEHMGFNLGNALKYIWRADLKGSAIEDLEKAVFYINRELEKRKAK